MTCDVGNLSSVLSALSTTIPFKATLHDHGNWDEVRIISAPTGPRPSYVYVLVITFHFVYSSCVDGSSYHSVKL